jgi:enoyl-CoA hydratase
MRGADDVHQTGHGHALSESGLPILMLLDGMKAEIGKPATAGNGP